MTKRLRCCLFLAGLSLLTGGCRDSLPEGAIRHPQERYAVRGGEPGGTLRLRSPALPRDQWPPALSEAARSVVIGALDSPAVQVFGSIEMVALDPLGRVFVLEQRSSEVRAFAIDGSHLFTVGRPGRGPGELTNPLSITFTGDGSLLVGDLSRQLHLFVPDSQGLAWRRSIRTQVSANALCVMGRRVFVHGVNLEHLHALSVYDLDGRFEQSFADVYRSPSPIINYTLSKGRLACDPKAGRLYFAPISGLGEVSAFDTAGRALWVTRIEDFLPTDLFEVGSGYGVQVPERGFTSVETLTLLDSTHVLLQVAYRTRKSIADALEFASLASFLLDARTGQGRSLGQSLPPIVAVGAGVRVAAQDDPFPRVLIDSVRTAQP